ncbi:MAG: thioredoxin [Candidatus Nanopelagicales bacterium]
MATTALTAGTFAETIESNEIVLVDWWADWCGPCKMFAPVFEKASEENPDIVFGKVDTEAEQSLAAQAQINSIPTIMVFRDGILLFAQPGALPGAALDDLISQVRALNMDEVRAEIAKEQAQA